MKKHLPAKVFNEIKKTFSEEKQNGFKTTVNARVVHEWLGVKTEFTTWIQRRIKKYDFTEHIDYCITKSFVKIEEANEIKHLTTKEYHCVPDMVKQLAMIESSDMGKLARLYFLDCEIRANEKVKELEERSKLRVEFRPMTDAIKEAHEEPKHYHYSNEADMINRIVLGKSAAQFRKHHEIGKKESVRDYMTELQMKAVIDLQRANTVFITMGMKFDERKEQLKKLFDKQFSQKLIDEVKAIEA